MTSVGVRELRQRASELLRRVERGETIQVTDCGRAVALLSAPPVGGPPDRLRAQGDIEPATRDLVDLGMLRPPDLRSLCAIHLATAALLGAELTAVVTYDQRLANAARQLGYRVGQPR